MTKALPIIVVSQFFCTSLWFAGNSVLPDLARTVQLDAGFLGHLTSAVQIGFIMGTLVFAGLGVADRISPSRVFWICAWLAALVNLGITLNGLTALHVLLFRLLTGFFLAGIYPVGMKIASDYSQRGLGNSLGFLVGALVLGTAFPHLVKGLIGSFPWRYVVFSTSLLSVVGGLAIGWLVPDGPFRQPAQTVNGVGSSGTPFRIAELVAPFRQPDFRAASLGYFGHMWEVYAFWAFVPVMLLSHQNHHPAVLWNKSLWAFLVIASGAVGCVVGGLLSRRVGSMRVAVITLSTSGVCCLLSPLFLQSPSEVALLSFLVVWSIAVATDSPQFSTLVAQNAPATQRGTALTLVTCLGFSISIGSIQLLNALVRHIPEPYLYELLAIGPGLGLWALRAKRG